MKKTKAKKQVAPKAEIMIQVQQPIPSLQDLQPEKSGSKYMIPKTFITEQQVIRMIQHTPPQHIYKRPAKGGGTWTYVTQSYVVKILNLVFGWNWDFKIIDKGREGDQVWVQGELTVKSPSGQQSITKTQFGRADIKFKRNSKEMLDYGNDLKAAASDALKKCASMIGIAADVYGKAEFREEANVDLERKTAPDGQNQTKVATFKPGQVIGPDGQPTWLCAEGDEPISEAEYTYSMKVFKKPLCREHQKNHGKK